MSTIRTTVCMCAELRKNIKIVCQNSLEIYLIKKYEFAKH